jgi:hypothetical protein
MLGMHAALRNFEALPRLKGDWGVVPGNGNFAAQYERLGVEVVAVIGGFGFTLVFTTR